MLLALTWIYFGLIVCSCICASCHEFILERAENAMGSKDNILSFEGLRVKKFNRTTYVLDGEYSLKIPLDNSISVKFTLMNFRGGEYKKFAEKSIPNYCDSIYIDEFKPYYEDFQASLTHPQPWKACPYLRGKNRVKNFMLIDKGAFPAYIPGGEKWRLDVRFNKDDIILGGYNMYILVLNDNSLLG